MLIRLANIAPTAVKQSKYNRSIMCWSPILCLFDISSINTVFSRALSNNAIIELDDTVDPLKTILNTKLKENAVKAEVERNNELQRSALRVIIHLSALLETGKVTEIMTVKSILKLIPSFISSVAGHAPKFEAMTREVKHGQLSNTYKNLVTELENKDYSTRVDAMDLS